MWATRGGGEMGRSLELPQHTLACAHSDPGTHTLMSTVNTLRGVPPFLCPLCLPPELLSQNHKELLCFSLSLTVPVPTLDLGMRPGRVQDLTGGRTPFLCLSFSIKN